MTRIAFTIYGKPKGKGRARAYKGRMITPKATVDAENAIGWECKLAMANAGVESGTGERMAIILGPVRVSIEAVFPIPKSWKPADRAAALTGRMDCISKPDKDNIEKLVLDALSMVAWADDSQVTRGPVVKRYGEPARTEVTVEAISEADSPKSPAQRRLEAAWANGPPPPRSKRKSPPVPKKPGILSLPRRIR